MQTLGKAKRRHNRKAMSPRTWKGAGVHNGGGVTLI